MYDGPASRVENHNNHGNLPSDATFDATFQAYNAGESKAKNTGENSIFSFQYVSRNKHQFLQMGQVLLMGAKSLSAYLALGGAALVGTADKLDLNRDTYGSLLNLPVIVSIVTIDVTTIFQFFLQYYF